VKIEDTTMEKDLGIYITSDLKPSTQCVRAARKARSVFAMVRRNFKRLDADDFLLIYKTYVSPQMEYCIQAWSPHLVKDINSGKCSKNSHQNGIHVKEITVRVKIT